MVGPSLLSPNALTFVPYCARPPACERERAAECTEVSTRAPCKNPEAACTPSGSNSHVHAHLLGPPVDEPAHAGQPACVYPKHQGLRAVSGLLDHSLSDLASGYRSQGGNLTVEGPRVPPRTLPDSPLQLDLVSQDDRRYNQSGAWQRPDQAPGYPHLGSQLQSQPVAQPVSYGWGMHVAERGVTQWGPGRQWTSLGPHVPASYMSVGPPNFRAQTHNPTSNLNSTTTSLGKMTKRDKITELHHETWQRRAMASPYAYTSSPLRGLVKGSPPGINSTPNTEGTESRRITVQG